MVKYKVNDIVVIFNNAIGQIVKCISSRLSNDILYKVILYDGQGKYNEITILESNITRKVDYGVGDFVQFDNGDGMKQGIIDSISFCEYNGDVHYAVNVDSKTEYVYGDNIDYGARM